jgi:TolA-binding protein
MFTNETKEERAFFCGPKMTRYDIFYSLDALKEKIEELRGNVEPLNYEKSQTKLNQINLTLELIHKSIDKLNS